MLRLTNLDVEVVLGSFGRSLTEGEKGGVVEVAHRVGHFRRAHRTAAMVVMVVVRLVGMGALRVFRVVEPIGRVNSVLEY